MVQQKQRCGWCVGDPLYEAYHDKEWGVPIYDDLKLFEFLILETFQAGLSWITILRKRENFRIAFDAFDYKKVAQYDADKFDTLIINKGIIRNKLKVNAALTNAHFFMKIQKEFGSFSIYIWGFVNNKPIKNSYKTQAELLTNSSLSDKISKDLKKRGFKFVGTTIIYAYLQAIGIVSDHIEACFRHH